MIETRTCVPKRFSGTSHALNGPISKVEVCQGFSLSMNRLNSTQ